MVEMSFINFEAIFKEERYHSVFLLLDFSFTPYSKSSTSLNEALPARSFFENVFSMVALGYFLFQKDLKSK